MSADDCILVAPFPEGWRVIHAQAIDNLDYYKEGTKEYNQMVRDYFEGSPVFSDKDKALEYASELEIAQIQDCGFPPEYGPCIVEKMMPPVVDNLGLAELYASGKITKEDLENFAL